MGVAQPRGERKLDSTKPNLIMSLSLSLPYGRQKLWKHIEHRYANA